MKKLIYILLLFVTVIVLDSCTKEDILTNTEIEQQMMNNNSRGQGDPTCNGGIVDPDKGDGDLDEDDDQIVDPDEDDDDMDEDDDELIEGQSGGNGEGA